LGKSKEDISRLATKYQQTTFGKTLGSLFVTFMKLNDSEKQYCTLLDQGAQISLIKKSVVEELDPDVEINSLVDIQVESASTHKIKVLGSCEVEVRSTEGDLCKMKFWIVSELSTDVVLGNNIYLEMGLCYNENKTFLFSKYIKFTSRIFLFKHITTNDWCVPIINLENVILRPYETKKIIAQVDPPSTIDDNKNKGQVRAAVVQQVVFIPDSINKIYPLSFLSDKPLRGMGIELLLSNMSDQQEVVVAGTVLSTLHSPDPEARILNVGSISLKKYDTPSWKNQRHPASMIEVDSGGIDGSVKETSESENDSLNINSNSEMQKQVVDNILEEFKDIFDETLYTEAHIPPIKLQVRDKPTYRRRKNWSKREADEIDKQVKSLLERDIIEPSDSPYSSPIVLVITPSKTRMCIDFRAVNKNTLKVGFTLPHSERMLDYLSGKEFFSSIDLTSGYHQVPLSNDSKHFTAFTTPRGEHFHYKRLPFGLVNAPGYFQKIMSFILGSANPLYAMCYLDDILIYSSSFSEHVKHVTDILSRLQRFNFKVKRSKCSFFKKEVKFLGFFISKNGIRSDPDKIAAIVKMPNPRNKKAVRGFLGATGWFRKFIQNYASIASPLTKLTRNSSPNDVTKVWTPDHQSAFDTLKKKLIEAPVLKLPDWNLPFVLDTDASEVALGGVLYQDLPTGKGIIGYHSRVFSTAECNYNISEKEALGVVDSVVKFRPYLYGVPFVIHTDHLALLSLKNCSRSQRLNRWALILSEYNFTIKHKKGKDNVLADFLSRHTFPTEKVHEKQLRNVMAEYLAQHKFFDDNHEMLESNNLLLVNSIQLCEELNFNLAEEQPKDPEVLKIIQVVKGNSDITIKDIQFYKLLKNVLYRRCTRSTRGKIISYYFAAVIPFQLVPRILSHVHNSIFFCHQGMTKMYLLLRERFWWKSMKQDIENFVRKCEICIRFNVDRSAQKGLLHPIPPPEKSFEIVGIDLIEEFPLSPSKNRYLMVVVDYLTKWCELIPMPSKSASITSRCFLESFLCRYGFPKCIVSDQGTNFTSKMFLKMLEYLELKKLWTVPYKPSTNGLVERMNSSIKSLIRKVLKGQDEKFWDVTLPYVQWALNSTVSTSSGFSPYQLVFGYPPTQMIDVVLGLEGEFKNTLSSSRDYADTLVERLTVVSELARENIVSKQNKQKEYFDKNKKEVRYEVGDLVAIKKMNIEGKFGERFDLAYLIVKYLPPDNYQVEPVNNIGNDSFTVHISQIKRIHIELNFTKEELITPGSRKNMKPIPKAQRKDTGKTLGENKGVRFIEKIIQKKKEKGKLFYRVKWENLPASHNSWISNEDLKNATTAIQDFETIQWLGEKNVAPPIEMDVIESKREANNQKESIKDVGLRIKKKRKLILKLKKDRNKRKRVANENERKKNILESINATLDIINAKMNATELKRKNLIKIFVQNVGILIVDGSKQKSFKMFIQKHIKTKENARELIDRFRKKPKLLNTWLKEKL